MQLPLGFAEGTGVELVEVKETLDVSLVDVPTLFEEKPPQSTMPINPKKKIFYLPPLKTKKKHDSIAFSLVDY
jgi:hypothetical protein